MHKLSPAPVTPDLLTLLPIGVVVMTRGLAITYANMAAENVLGETIPYLRKRKFSDLFHPAQKLQDLIHSAFKTNAPLKEYGFTLTGPRIGSLMITLHIQPISVEEVLLCFDDASAAQTLSHSALQLQNSRTQGNMAAILAHEVKNPLSGIRGAAQLLDKTVKPEDRELTALIRNEADRIKSVVEEMEFFSNPSELKSESVNIHEVLHYAKTVTEKGAGKHVKFIERFDPSLPPVAGNKNLLIQVFINLLKNAIEATDKNAIITITSSYQSGVRVRRGNTVNFLALPILITIADNGHGIAPELRDNIFEPFFTSKASGKGLGLAIVAKIIADHGGIIELDTEHDEGTCFNVLLPAV